MGLLLEAFKLRFLKYNNLVLKAYGNNIIGLQAAKGEVVKVPFIKSNPDKRAGKPLTVYTEVKEIKHTLEGTSKPVHICISGIMENTSLLERYKPDQSAEALTRWGMLNYETGWQARDAMSAVGAMDVGKQMKYLMIGVIIAVVINVSLMWQILNTTGTGAG